MNQEEIERLRLAELMRAKQEEDRMRQYQPSLRDLLHMTPYVAPRRDVPKIKYNRARDITTGVRG